MTEIARFSDRALLAADSAHTEMPRRNVIFMLATAVPNSAVVANPIRVFVNLGHTCLYHGIVTSSDAASMSPASGFAIFIISS
jgi:hypothetical protein